MSSDSDGAGGNPQDWTHVDNHGNAEDSEDSSGSSLDFVDLGEDVVRYRHVSRTSSAISIPSTNQTSPYVASASLPANFRANSFNDQGEISGSEGEKPCNDAEYGIATRSKVSNEPAPEQNQSPNKVMSSVEISASSSTPTLVESQSDFSSFSSDLGNLERISDEDIQLKGSTNSQASPGERSEENADRLPGVAFDRVSVDSIEVLEMPSDKGRSQQGDMKEEKDLVAVTRTAEENHSEMKESGTDCSCEESDTSEFERIEPGTIPQEEDRNQTGGEDDDEDSKMDVAGAIPVEELVKAETQDIITFEKDDQPQNLTEAGCRDHMNAYSHFPEPLNPSPPLSPNMESPSTSRNTFPWQGPGVSRMIQPFPLDLLPENGAAPLLASHGFPSSLHLQPPNRQGLQRQHSSSSSEEGFELLRRPRVRQEDDVASTVSSSSSDLSSSFVNVRRRRGPPVSQHHSDNDDMLDSISSFTDCSEDCLPANMMVQSQASGVKQYKHHRDEGLNTRLDWLVAMVLFAGLALGIGHFIGSSQEIAHQRSINTGQVQRLRELQDDLVTCLDRTLGIDSRIATEKTSPALQAVRLMEGLNSRMQEENLNAGRLLGQKVGPVDGDATKRSGVEDTVPKPTDTDTYGEKPVSSPDVQSNKNKNFKDVTPDSQLGDDSSGELESERLVPSLDDNSGPSEADSISKIQLASGSAGISSVETQQQGEVFNASVISDGSESNKTGGKLGETAEEIQEDVSNEDDNLGRLDRGKLAKKDSESDDGDNDARIFDDPTDNDQESKDVSPSESTNTDPEDSAVEMLQRKLELMEEKMNQMMKTTQYWEEMRAEEQRVKKHEDREKILESESSNTAKDEATNEEDPLAGIASTLKSLWPDVLKTDKGKEFLQYLNHTWGSFSHSNSSQNKSSWSDVLYQELAALKTIPESEQVQTVLNNTKLLALHLQNELELVTSYLKNQSLNLVQENNITVEGLSEQVNGAWAKLKNVTSDVVDFNKDVLFSVGEQLTDTLRSVKNVSANFINEQNISVSKLGSMADQVWGTVKNYSSLVRDSVLNRTADEPAEHSEKEFHDDLDLDEESDTSSKDKFNKKSGSEPNTDASSGFGEKLKGAWDTVRNYSSNFTRKQNLSISGLREQVKAAWGKVKNTSSQVLQDVSKLNLAEKVKDGAEDLGKKVKSGAKELGKKMKEGAKELGKKVQEGAKTLGEKVGTTFKSIKKTAERFHKTKRPRERKKHRDRSKRHQESHKRTEETRNKKRQKHSNRQRQRGRDNKFHPEKKEKKSSIYRKDGKFHNHHHNRHERHQHQTNKKHESLNDKQDLGKHYSVPTRQHHQLHLPRDTSNKHTQQQQGKIPHYSPPPKVQPLHEESNLQSGEHSLPKRKEKRQTIFSHSDTKSVDDRKEEKHDHKVKLKEGKSCPKQMVSDPNRVGENHADSNWEDLFDCVDMHCKGDDKCMHSQRRDAARLYSELLDYEQWLEERNLRKDVRELREFLEELGEFLSETDSDDRDLDELKDEFGEMVQDMEDGARKRHRKQNKLSKSRSQESLKSHHADATHKQQNTKSENVQDKAETENSTVIIDLESLPQQGDPRPEQGQFSSSESYRTSESNERRKFAGRGFQSTDDDRDWYLQRAKDREDQRGSNNWPKSGKLRDTGNWYMHWVQGRINGRTGVTVWDMYEWIKERYMFREELRRHEMDDHVNWFLRKP